MAASRTGRRLEIVFVLASTQNAFFFELAELFGHELTALGIPWRISERGMPPFASHRINVLLPPHEYFVLARQDRGLVEPAMLARTIGICTEQPNTSHFDDNHRIVGRLGRTFDVTLFALAETHAKDLPVDHLQLGHSPLLDAFDPNAERDIDVAFVGCRSDRRDFLMAGLAPVLARYRCHLAFSDNSAPNGRTANASAFLWGAAKQRVLARTRILLNIHQSDTPYFEWQRAIEAISAGAVLLSDTSAGVAPLVPGRHLFFTRPEAMGHVLAALLEDEPRLRRVRHDAHRFLVERLPMRAAAETLVEAAYALAARPSFHGRQFVGMPATTEVPERMLEGPRPAEPPSFPRVEGSVLAAAVKRLRLDVMDIRRDLDGGGDPGPARVAYRTAAHRLLADVEVSTITALYNQGEFVAGALDSLSGAAGPRTELVIVDDGSTDDAHAVVLPWLRVHEHVPAVLVAHGRNRGLAHARNTAVAFARGRFVFVLDSDNAVFPDCLDRLADVLRVDEGAAFAYPLIERHDMLGPLGLLPPFGWNPRRLRQGNYIDAMAMIRADVLRQLGGYSTDRRLYGWEDYDLWCRVAEAGLRGVLVPALLARYRDSPISMRSVTNVDHSELYAVLAERSPRLFAGLLGSDGGASA